MICPRCNQDANTLYSTGESTPDLRCERCVDEETGKTIALAVCLALAWVSAKVAVLLLV